MAQRGPNISVACENCRKDKKKCSGEPNPCHYCKKKEIVCLFPERKKKNQRLMNVNSKLEVLEQEYNSLPQPQQAPNNIYLKRNRDSSSPNSYQLVYYQPSHLQFDFLIRIFLENYLKVFPFILVSRIFSELKKGAENSPLINAICCLSQEHHRKVLVTGNKESTFNVVNFFYTRAIHLLSLDKLVASIELVQTYLLLSQYETYNVGEVCDMHLSLGVSMAKALGLHDNSWYRDEKDLYDEFLLERSATWSFCCYFDLNNSVFLLKPFLISSYNYDSFENDKFYDEIASIGLPTEYNTLKVGIMYYKVARFQSCLMTIRKLFFSKKITSQNYLHYLNLHHTKVNLAFPDFVDDKYFLKTTIQDDPCVAAYRQLKIILGIDKAIEYQIRISLNDPNHVEMNLLLKQLNMFISVFDHLIPGYWDKYNLISYQPGLLAYHLHKCVVNKPEFFPINDRQRMALISSWKKPFKVYPWAGMIAEKIVDLSKVFIF